MVTMSDFLNTSIDYRASVKDSFVGIEIELENFLTTDGLDEKLDDLNYWNLVDDGSLKLNGVEFVSNAPTLIGNVPDAITELWDILDTCNPLVTSRTSVHVHVDVLNMTVDSFLNYVMLCVLLERVLYTVGGLHRIHNNNCVPVGNTHLPLRLKNAMDRGDPIIWPKYTGINVGSMVHNVSDGWEVERRGTIEFRMHEGTLDSEEISNWVFLLQYLKDIAMDQQKYEQLMHTITEGNCLKVLDTFNLILGTHAPYVYKAYKENKYTLFKDILSGYHNVLNLCMDNSLTEAEKDILNTTICKFNGRPIKAAL